MKILFVAAQYDPFKKQKGGCHQRSHLLVEALSQFSSVDVVVFSNGSVSDIQNANVIFSKDLLPESHGLTNFKNRFLRILHPLDPTSFFPVFRKKEKLLDDIISKFRYDYICIRYMEPAIQLGLTKYSDRLIVDVDDYPVDGVFKKAKLSNNWSMRIHYYAFGNAMKLSMYMLLKKLKFSFYPNTKQPHTRNSAYLPNIPFYTMKKSLLEIMDNHVVLFVGPMGYEPNYNGVLHFIKNVLPIIKKSIPDVMLRIVGASGDDHSEHILSSYSNISRVGYVDNLISEYNNCHICIAPIYAGAGTNIKVIETMQMHRPCVVTQTASRGFEDVFVDGEDYFIAKDDNDFAEKIIKLLNNKSLCDRIADNGYNKYEKNFSKARFFSIVADSIINKC